jgi:hypothetical protein
MTQFDNIVVTPVYGSLNTANYPNSLPYHSFGTLINAIPNPPLFYPSQEPVYSDQNVILRKQYIQTVNKHVDLGDDKQKINNPVTYYSHSTQGRHSVSTNVNYTPPQDSSSYILRKKALAMGKSSFKVGLAPNAEYTTKSYYPSGVKSSLGRVRSGGCVAPKKKGAVYNTSV